jgi:RNA polymerase sigma-70 factor (ECF subfamily)
MPSGEPANGAGDSSPDSTSDDSLMRRLVAGSESAARRLYARYVARLRALARARLSTDVNARVDPEDIVQSVFRRFFHAARRGNYDAPAATDLWDLLLVITLNKIRSEESYQRAAKRDVRRTTAGGAEPYLLEQVADRDETAASVLQLHIEEALGRLPAASRRVVELRMEEHGVAEIARHTGRSKRTVERILQESRDTLKDLLIETDSR